MMDEKMLAEIESRANAAAPGPWERYDAALIGPDGRGVARYFTEPAFIQTMDFIAAARTDVPALVAEARRFREALEGLVKINAGDFQTHAHGPIDWDAFPVTFGYANAFRAALAALGRDRP